MGVAGGWMGVADRPATSTARGVWLRMRVLGIDRAIALTGHRNIQTDVTHDIRADISARMQQASGIQSIV